MPRHSFSTLLYVSAVAAALSACGHDGPTGNRTPGLPSAVQVMAGNEQSGRVGEELPTAVVVRVVDANSTPVVGQSVSFVVTSGGGHVFAGTANTDANGVAQERWTLGTVASQVQSLEARAVSSTTGDKIVFARFTATATAGAPATIAKEAGDAQSGTAGAALATQLAVKVLDSYGNPVPNFAVTWAPANGGSVPAPTTTTGADGIARTTWTLGAAAGAQSATATVGSLAPISFTATARSGAVTRLELVRGDAQTAPAASAVPTPLAVRATDAFGNPVAGVTVTWLVTSGGGAISAIQAATAVDGVAEARWTLGVDPGPNGARATAGGIPPVNFTATAGPRLGVRGWTSELVFPTEGGFTTAVLVWTSGPNDVWAAGAWDHAMTGGVAFFASRNQGSGWVPTVGESNYIRAFTGVAPGNVVLGVQTNSAAMVGLWKEQGCCGTNMGGRFPQIITLWGSGPNDIYAGSAELPSSSLECGCSGLNLKHFDGTTWTPIADTDVFSYEGISGSGPNDVYMVARSIVTGVAGTRPLLIHRTPSGTTRIALPSSVRSIASNNGGSTMWVAAPNDVFLLGSSTGTVVRYDGSTFTTMATPATGALYAIWGSSASDVYAVGAGGSIVHFDGVNWSLETSGTTMDLASVWGSSASAPVYVGSVLGGYVLTGIR